MAALTADEINAKVDRFLEFKPEIHAIAEFSRACRHLKLLEGA